MAQLRRKHSRRNKTPISQSFGKTMAEELKKQKNLWWSSDYYNLTNSDFDEYIETNPNVPYVNITLEKNGIGTDINSYALYATNKNFVTNIISNTRDDSNNTFAIRICNHFSEISPKYFIYEQFLNITNKIKNNNNIIPVFKGGLALAKVIENMLENMDPIINVEMFKKKYVGYQAESSIFKYGDFDTSIYVENNNLEFINNLVKNTIKPVMLEYQQIFEQGFRMFKNYRKNFNYNGLISNFEYKSSRKALLLKSIIKFLARLDIIINLDNKYIEKKNEDKIIDKNMFTDLFEPQNYAKIFKKYIKEMTKDISNNKKLLNNIKVYPIINPFNDFSQKIPRDNIDISQENNIMTVEKVDEYIYKVDKNTKKRKSEERPYFMKSSHDKEVDKNTNKGILGTRKNTPYFISYNKNIKKNEKNMFKLLRSKFNYGTLVKIPARKFDTITSHQNSKKNERYISFPGEMIDISIATNDADENDKTQKLFKNKNKNKYLLNFDINREDIVNKSNNTIYIFSLEYQMKDILYTFEENSCIWDDKKFKKRLRRFMVLLGLKFILEKNKENRTKNEWEKYVNNYLKGFCNYIENKNTKQKCIEIQYNNQDRLRVLNDIIKEIKKESILDELDTISHNDIKILLKKTKNTGSKTEIVEELSMAVNKMVQKHKNITKYQLYELVSDKNSDISKYSNSMYEIQMKTIKNTILYLTNEVFIDIYSMTQNNREEETEKKKILETFFGKQDNLASISNNNGCDILSSGGNKRKKTRKHNGIHQSGGNKGRLKKGYKYSGKKLKSGLPQIIKSKKIKSKKN